MATLDPKYQLPVPGVLEMLLQLLQTGQISTMGDLHPEDLKHIEDVNARVRQALQYSGTDYHSQLTDWIRDKFGDFVTPDQLQQVSNLFNSTESLLGNLIPDDIKHMVAGPHGNAGVAIDNLIKRHMIGYDDPHGRAYIEKEAYMNALGVGYATMFTDAERASGAAPNYKQMVDYQNILGRSGALVPRSVGEHLRRGADGNEYEVHSMFGASQDFLHALVKSDGSRTNKIKLDEDGNIEAFDISKNEALNIAVKELEKQSDKFKDAGLQKSLQLMVDTIVDSTKEVHKLHKEAQNYEDAAKAFEQQGNIRAAEEQREKARERSMRALELQRRANERISDIVNESPGLEEALDASLLGGIADSSRHKQSYMQIHEAHKLTKSALTLMGQDTSQMKAEDFDQALMRFAGHRASLKNEDSRSEAAHNFHEFVRIMQYDAKGYDSHDIETLYRRTSAYAQGTSLERYAGHVSLLAAESLAHITRDGNANLNHGTMGQSGQEEISGYISDQTTRALDSDVKNAFGTAIAMGLVKESDFGPDGYHGNLQSLKDLSEGKPVSREQFIQEAMNKSGADRSEVESTFGDRRRTTTAVMKSGAAQRAVVYAANRQRDVNYRPRTDQEHIDYDLVRRNKDRLDAIQEILRSDNQAEAKALRDALMQAESGSYDDAITLLSKSEYSGLRQKVGLKDDDKESWQSELRISTAAYSALNRQRSPGADISLGSAYEMTLSDSGVGAVDNTEAGKAAVDAPDNKPELSEPVNKPAELKEDELPVRPMGAPKNSGNFFKDWLTSQLAMTNLPLTPLLVIKPIMDRFAGPRPQIRADSKPAAEPNSTTVAKDSTAVGADKYRIVANTVELSGNITINAPSAVLSPEMAC